MEDPSIVDPRVLMEEKLRTEIRELSAKLADMKHELFNLRLFNMLGKTEQELAAAGITDICFGINDENTDDSDDSENTQWFITYTHHIINYDDNAYINNVDSEADTSPVDKTFHMSFGKNKKYYIKGNNKTRFKVYKNSLQELRIINTDYSIELDMDEHEALSAKYMTNLHIPEWIAIKVFCHMSEQEWSDDNLINYMRVD